MTAVKLAQYTLDNGMTEGEGVGARLFAEYWMSGGVSKCDPAPITQAVGVVCADSPLRGKDGRTGVASSCASPLLVAAAESTGGVALREHLTQRCSGPVVGRHAL